MLLLAGGISDPNLAVLGRAAEQNGVPVVDLRLKNDGSPAFCWNLDECKPRLDGKPMPATGAFIRHDVFSGLNDPRPEVNTRAYSWYQAVFGWLLAESQVRLFNRDMIQAANNKPAVLKCAAAVGLKVPPTLVTNDVLLLLGEGTRWGIAKPVGGGDFCYPLMDALENGTQKNGVMASPAIVQPRLVGPEVRIYIIGNATFAFELKSNSLDYRVHQDAELGLLPDTPREANPLRKLMSRLGMDFGAADFKTDPDSGDLVFLELNTSPMFARFDEVAGGKLSAAMVKHLASQEGNQNVRA